MNKFEKLIEFVINDEHDKARELFHDIVVEKSRGIYEDLMSEEEEEGFEADEESSDDADFGSEEGEEEEESDDEDFGDEDDMDFGDEEDESEGSLEDRVVDLEDQLDELMSEFEALMSDEDEGLEDDDFGGDEADEFGDELGGDDFGGEDDFGDEDYADDGMDMMAENVDLLAAPKPVTSEESWVSAKSPNANNSGAIGAVAKPVPAGSETAKGGSAPKVGELIGKVQNTVGGDKKLSAAPKPVTSQASGTNTVTPFPKV